MAYLGTSSALQGGVGDTGDIVVATVNLDGDTALVHQ